MGKRVVLPTSSPALLPIPFTLLLDLAGLKKLGSVQGRKRTCCARILAATASTTRSRLLTMAH